MAPHDTGPVAPRGRLLAFYAVLAALTGVGVAISISAGEDEQPQPAIAGGYALEEPDTCLGDAFSVKQSGRFVNLESGETSLGAKLEFEDGELSGDVDCIDGESAELSASVGEQRIEGTVAGRGFAATFAEDPPAPGARDPLTPDAIDGEYALAPRSGCLGGAFELEGEGRELALVAGGTEAGEVTYADGELTGAVGCGDGTEAALTGTAADRKLDLALEPEGPTLPPERLTATKQREFPLTLAAFFIAIAVVMLMARLVGSLAVRVGQPRVMGEVVAGIALGPTIFGAITPELQAEIFPLDIIPLIGVVANLGLIFYMFLVGLELDASQLRGRVAQALAISNASVALPMVLGMAAAVPIYGLVGPDTEFVAFALFMGVAMSITAFPVLARILVERRMLKRPVGALAMASAAIDDVTAWFLIALALAVAAASGSGSEVVETVLLAGAFCVVMFLVVRPLIGRVSTAYDEVGRVPSGWIAAIFAGVLLAAYTTELIGIAIIFGAFVMGLVMPRHAGLTEDVTRRVEDFVVILLLPLFFTYTGLRTDIGLLDRPELWLLTLALIAVAIVGKLAGAMIAARVSGMGWRASAVIGTLMNTRGLTELIVLNLALEAGVISEALFAALVIMALVTTFMAGPLLRLLDPRNEFGAPVEEEFDEAREESAAAFPALAIPGRAILVAPQSDAAVAQLLTLAKPLASSEPPRELILAQLVPPPSAAAAGVRGGLQTENMLLERASAQMRETRDALVDEGIAARAVAFISPDAGEDLSRIASQEEVDLVLVDGRRPLLGEGVPRGEVGSLLEHAPCDVAVLVAREGEEIEVGADGRPLVVPFGGSEHDWAALELGAWLASATRAPLKLLGAAGETEEVSRVTRRLGDAGLLVQQYAGVHAEPVVAEPGGLSVVEAAEGAGLLVVGLSDRWRQEGLGATRSEVVRAAAVPVLFVRRGTRPGALAPRDDVTRFAWSSAGV
jgi:Kef-type K+ transport system membrane component KefB